MYEPIYYTLKQVSQKLQLSESTIRRLIKKGEIPKAHFCGKILIPAWFIDKGLHQPEDKEVK